MKRVDIAVGLLMIVGLVALFVLVCFIFGAMVHHTQTLQQFYQDGGQ